MRLLRLGAAPWTARASPLPLPQERVSRRAVRKEMTHALSPEGCVVGGLCRTCASPGHNILGLASFDERTGGRKNLSWKLRPIIVEVIEIAIKKQTLKIPYRILTLLGTLISLLNPTQDLVFARAIRGHAVGGGFRDLTVRKTAGTGRRAGGVQHAPQAALAGISL